MRGWVNLIKLILTSCCFYSFSSLRRRLKRYRVSIFSSSSFNLISLRKNWKTKEEEGKFTKIEWMMLPNWEIWISASIQIPALKRERRQFGVWNSLIHCFLICGGCVWIILSSRLRESKRYRVLILSNRTSFHSSLAKFELKQKSERMVWWRGRISASILPQLQERMKAIKLAPI